MRWKLDIVYVRDGYDTAIVDIETKDIIAVVSYLDVKYVSHIIDEHNKAINSAMKEGADIAKEVYNGK